MNAGLIFSLCAGILIGLKLFYCMKKSDKREKDDCRKQYQEVLNFFNQKAEMDQRKASLEMQLNLLRQKLELEKAKQISKEQGYISPLWLVSDSTVTTNNDNVWQPSYFDPRTFEHANEAVRKEKLRMIVRDLWYGTGIKSGFACVTKDDAFEEMLKDPTTIFMETESTDPLEPKKIVMKSRGKEFVFVPEYNVYLRY